MSALVESLDIIGSSFLTVIVSELGDKTFISTAVLAMKYSKTAVFFGNISSMCLMMAIASYIGYTVMVLLDPHYVRLFSILVFIHFSTLSFWEAYKNSKEEEQLEVKNNTTKWVSVLWQTMVLVFFAEWGDKSQIGIITLSAIHPAALVMTGAVIAILCCAFIAVMFGKLFHGYVSETLMGYLSGLVFLLFALIELKTHLTQ